MTPHFQNEGCEFLDEALSDLGRKGYTADLSFETDPYGLYAGDLDIRLNPEVYHVDEVDQTRDEANANEEAIVYAVSFYAGVKGVIVDEKK